MARSVLLLLSQMPQDPGSGAARSMATNCELLARAGFGVRAVATTAVETSGVSDPADHLDSMGVSWDAGGLESAPGARVLGFERRGVTYRLLDVGATNPKSWQEEHGEAFDRLLDDELRSHPPEIVLTFGSRDPERARRARARATGATVVFALKNLSYFNKHAFGDVDAVVVPSLYMRDRYRREIGLASAVLYPPFSLEDVVAPERDARYLTFVNPSPAKGLMLTVRLIDELCRASPGLPVMIVEGRGALAPINEAARRGGIDLESYDNIRVATRVPQPKDYFAETRVLVAPSVWAEPFGRIAPEALFNGVPPIVSDRGGLPEAANKGGVVIPLPRELTPKSPFPVSPEAAAPWRGQALRLMTDDAAYAKASARALAAAERFRPERLEREYVAYFDYVRRGPERTRGPGLD